MNQNNGNPVWNLGSTPVCPTGKKPYSNQFEAKQAAIWMHQAIGLRLQRPYVCDQCYQWHLTSPD